MKKRIEMWIGIGVGLGSLSHVDLIALDDLADQQVFPRRPGPAGGPVHQSGQRPVRQQILQENLGFHGRKYSRRRLRDGVLDSLRSSFQRGLRRQARDARHSVAGQSRYTLRSSSFNDARP